MEFMVAVWEEISEQSINQQIGFSGFSNMPFFAIFVSGG